MNNEPLPSPSESAAVQEALSIRYVDKIGLAWLPGASAWAVFSNSGKLVALTSSLDEKALRDLCAGQDREWRQRLEAELEAKAPGPPVAKVALGDLDL